MRRKASRGYFYIFSYCVFVSQSWRTAIKACRLVHTHSLWVYLNFFVFRKSDPGALSSKNNCATWISTYLLDSLLWWSVYYQVMEKFSGPVARKRGLSCRATGHAHLSWKDLNLVKMFFYNKWLQCFILIESMWLYVNHNGNI